MDAQTLKQLIEQGLPGARAEVYGADGVHFEARVTSPAFAGQPTLARHRMVYAALGELMGGEIHALALKTVAPEEATGPGARDSGLGQS
jgi:acid stress-induced BolA-like protein IbaG/YrbA